MSRVIESPVKRWPGTVTVADPLSYPQLLAWRTAVDNAGEAKDPAETHAALIPGVLACVERWELANFPEKVTADNFPATPIRASVALIGALVDAINAVLLEDVDYPNE